MAETDHIQLSNMAETVHAQSPSMAHTDHFQPSSMTETLNNQSPSMAETEHIQPSSMTETLNNQSPSMAETVHIHSQSIIEEHYIAPTLNLPINDHSIANGIQNNEIDFAKTDPHSSQQNIVTLPEVDNDHGIRGDESMQSLPGYSFSTSPRLLAQGTLSQGGSNGEFELPIMTGSCPANNFIKGAKWCPDGSCFLTWADDCALRVVSLPASLDYSSTHVQPLDQWGGVKEGGTIYSACWYPLASAVQGETCLFLSSSMDKPMHLWDALAQNLRATYRAYNHLDEITAAYSVAFTLDGTKIYSGFDRTIRVFDVSRPGRDCTVIPTASKKKRSGLKGIISCFAFAPDGSKLLAAGSYGKSIGVYAEGSKELLCLLEGATGGVTQVEFSRDGYYLFSGSRMDPHILCWDIRNTANVLCRLPRTADSNQRITFDFDPTGRYLITGSREGHWLTYDLSDWFTSQATNECTNANSTDSLGNVPTLAPALKIDTGCRDAVNSVSCHPFYPFVLTGSGQRHFDLLLDDDDEGQQLGDGSEMQRSAKDNCVRVWLASGQ